MSRAFISRVALGLTFCIFCVSTWADQITVGRRAIEVPTPEGFATLTRAMSPYYKSARAYIAPTNYRYVMFIPAWAADAILRGKKVEFVRNINVESAKKTSELMLTAAQFGELRRIIRTLNQTLYEKILAKVPSAIDAGNAEIRRIFDTDLGMSIGNVMPLPVHAETSDLIASSMYINYVAAMGGEEIDRGVVAATAVAIYVRGKVLMLYVYGAETDLDWTRDFGNRWARQILAAN